MVDRFDDGLHWVPPTRTISPGVVRIRHTYVANTIDELIALPRKICDHGQEATVIADDSHWRFEEESDQVDVTGFLILALDDRPLDLGHWVRTDSLVHLKLPISFQTSDAAQLIKVPAGITVEIDKIFWETTQNWVDGGPPPAIGISTDTAPFDTQGDLLGGASGSKAGDLNTAVVYSAEPPGPTGTGVVVLKPNVVVRFDRITSQFAAGAGFIHAFVRPI